jgi:hypothetical protein
MADLRPIERRKNPSRKRTVVFDVVYQVLWNDERKSFDVYRNEEKTGGFARDKATAIGLAISSAQKEAADLKISVTSLLNRKTTVEWSR